MSQSKKSGLAILIILALASSCFLFSGCHYIFKALVHQKPNIHDLDLFPYRTIEASKGAQALAKASDYNGAELPENLRKTLEDYQAVAFLVLKDGQIQYEEYWDGYSEAKNSNAFSATKSIVSILVGMAKDQGYIQSLDQPVGDFLPEFKEGKKAGITIRDVLSMASGLSFDEAYNKPISDTTEAYYGKDLKGLINGLAVVEEPGAVWYYRSGDTMLLAMVLEAATGMTTSEFAQKSLWQPLGAVHDAQWSLDREGGLEKAYCCFYSNARDFARVGQLYLDNGRVNGEPILSEQYIVESLKPVMIPDRNGDMVDYYGLQWWLYNEADTPIHYARGILGQYIFVIPEKNMVVVRLGHHRSQNKVDHHPEDVHALVKGVLDTF